MTKSLKMVPLIKIALNVNSVKFKKSRGCQKMMNIKKTRNLMNIFIFYINLKIYLS